MYKSLLGGYHIQETFVHNRSGTILHHRKAWPPGIARINANTCQVKFTEDQTTMQQAMSYLSSEGGKWYGNSAAVHQSSFAVSKQASFLVGRL